ncbi:hypothetical protein [Streptomyces sp. NPDC002952]
MRSSTRPPVVRDTASASRSEIVGTREDIAAGRYGDLQYEQQC